MAACDIFKNKNIVGPPCNVCMYESKILTKKNDYYDDDYYINYLDIISSRQQQQIHVRNRCST